MEGVFNEGLQNMVVGWKIWFYWMVVINMSSIFFVRKHTPARAVLIVWAFNAISMMVAAEFLGFTRILGLVHVIYWTALAIYLFLKIINSKKKAYTINGSSLSS